MLPLLDVKSLSHMITPVHSASTVLTHARPPCPPAQRSPTAAYTASGILPCVVPPGGIEPPYRVPQTRVLPLNQGGIVVWTSRVRTRCGSEPCAVRPLPLIQD